MNPLFLNKGKNRFERKELTPFKGHREDPLFFRNWTGGKGKFSIKSGKLYHVKSANGR